MTGRKTLAQVRAELEAALGTDPAGKGEVVESLRRFLAAGSEPVVPSTSPPTPGTKKPATTSKRGR